MAILILAIGLGGCSTVRNSALNPFNWFGGGNRDAAESGAPAPQADPRPMVERLTRLGLDRRPGGVIVSAVGLTATQGYWDAELVPSPSQVVVDPVLGRRIVPRSGEIVFEFRAAPPPAPARVGTAPSREIAVGLYLGRKSLDGVRRITVVTAGNRRSVRVR
ncbi:MAG: hypothetical protein D6688_01815 [Alphaproteobacteria bacterium]|nr:MAG: hypothetical protein D6688_01815 [Alphaproteobacteria bacterium]